MISRREFETILVPWNFNDSSQACLADALKLAGETTKIHVVHVAVPLSGPDNGALYLVSSSHKRSKHRNSFYKQISPEMKDPRIQFEVEFGNVERELLASAKRNHVDLIVMPKPKKRGFATRLFGNVASNIQQKSNCQVKLISQQDSGKSWSLAERMSSGTATVACDN